MRSGQHEDPEGAKYRMLEDDEGVPPERKAGAREVRPPAHRNEGP